LVPVITATVVWFGWMGRHDRAFAEQESRLNSGERSQWFET
jgi:hypothetical protein